MDNWQAILSVITFISVIILVMTEWVHFTIAALLGALLLVFTNVMTVVEYFFIWKSLRNQLRE